MAVHHGGKVGKAGRTLASKCRLSSKIDHFLRLILTT